MIQEVISIFFEDETVTFGSLKKEITDPDEIKATSTVKVVTDQKGDAMYFSRSVIPSNVKDGKLAAYSAMSGFMLTSVISWKNFPKCRRRNWNLAKVSSLFVPWNAVTK